MISSLEDWARYHWRLKGNLSLFPLGGSWILFEFDLAREAERVLQEILSVFRQRPLKLERWSPTIGCLSKRAQTSSHWVRIVGLLLCLWHKDFFKQVGDVCGGGQGDCEGQKFTMGTSFNQNKWKKKVSGRLQVVLGELCYSVNLWWETPPWVAPVVPRVESQEEREKKSSDSSVASRMGCTGSNLVEKVSLSGRMKHVEEVAPSVPLVGRLQQEVQEHEFAGAVWEEG